MRYALRCLVNSSVLTFTVTHHLYVRKTVSRYSKNMNEFSDELLRLYYERLFPASLLCKWLDHSSNMKLLRNREFSFTLEGDIYIRYLSFKNAAELLKEVKRKQPRKIDIGAIYNIEPAKKKSVRASSFIPKQRELVFDIDLTDYEEVMGSTKSESIWGINSSRWKYMSTAMRIMTDVLRHDFGMKSFIWIFSGRRGVHCWVNDAKARELTDSQRKTILTFVTVLSGKKLEVRFPLHPTLERCLPVLKASFEELCETDNILEDKKNVDLILAQISDSELKEQLKAQLEGETDSLTIWGIIKNTVTSKSLKLLKNKKGSKEGLALQNSLIKILFYFTYPRLDVNVSIHRNHLLKSPFVAHPKTGKICVPIKEEDFDLFNPERVPTLRSLIDELNNTMSEEGNPKEKDFEKTSLKPYIDHFQTVLFEHASLEKKINTQKSEVKQTSSVIPTW